MIIDELKIKGLFVIIPEPSFDNRGFFMRTYDNETFCKAGLCSEWVQENHSRSEYKGTIRGLHLQLGPYAETKLVRCIRGGIFDVAVDLRKNSETFGRWLGIELNEENKKMFYIPKGFAHGFCTLTDRAEVLYKVDNIYNPEFERGILWNDKDLKIDWPLENPIISQKDRFNLTIQQYLER